MRKKSGLAWTLGPKMSEIEETWSPEPVKAWRYFWVGPLTWNWSEDRWEVMLRGDVEDWTGPVKYAGQHDEPDLWLTERAVDHESPHMGCMCGVNAVKRLDSHEIKHRVGMWCECRLTIRNAGVIQVGEEEIRTVAVGEVELAGIVDEYELGYRAQQATIVGPLYLISGDAKRAKVLAENYGVEVTEDWYPMFRRLQNEEQKEEADGHRKADTPDHRGAGTSQDTGTGKGTRKDTLTRLSFAIGIPLVWMGGAQVMALSDAWYGYVAWFVACGVGTFGTLAHADFLKRR